MDLGEAHEDGGSSQEHNARTHTHLHTPSAPQEQNCRPQPQHLVPQPQLLLYSSLMLGSPQTLPSAGTALSHKWEIQIPGESSWGDGNVHGKMS